MKTRLRKDETKARHRDLQAQPFLLIPILPTRNEPSRSLVTRRWEDYTTTAMDPSDDCTFWYVGDYLKAGDTSYRTRIGSFRLPNCKGGQ